MATNGRLDTSTLTKVDGWALLTKNAAAAWERGCDDLVAMGYPRPSITAPDGAYRPYAQQVAMKEYWTAQGKPLNAATPGTSGHGWATDVDIFKNWLWPHDVLVEVFGKYGFTFNVSWEAWHMHHNGMAVAALNVTPIEIELEHQMVTLWNTDDETRRAYYDGINFEEQSEYVSTIERLASGTPVNVNQDQWDQLKANADRRRAALVADIAAAVPKPSGTVDYAALAAAMPKKITGTLS